MGRIGNETAIIYVLDAKFLRSLKVLHFSLAEQQTLQSCPVVVITDDRDVAEDPFVRSIASTIEFVTPEEIAVFSTLRGDRIAPTLATSFAPKYTFLKLLMFKDRGFKRHVFIDADMLCVKPFDEDLLSAAGDAKAVREFGAGTFPVRREPRSESYPRDAYRWINEHSEPVETTIRGINSGFVVLEGDAINDDLFEYAIATGSSGSFPSEQALTTECLKNNEIPYLRLPIWYNARRRMFASLGEEFFERVRDDIVILHYTPGKPWKMRPEEIRPWDRLWIDCEQRASDWIAERESARSR